MIDYLEATGTVPPKKLSKEKNSFTNKIHPASFFNIESQKPKTKINKVNKNKIALHKWIMPPQPEGYIRAGKYDFL